MKPLTHYYKKEHAVLGVISIFLIALLSALLPVLGIINFEG